MQRGRKKGTGGIMASLPRYANAACSVPWVGLAVLLISERSMLLSARGWQPHLAMSRCACP